MLLDTGGGGSGSGYPWPHYTASPGDVSGDGDAISKTSQTIHNTMSSVDGTHHPAQTATVGAVQTPMLTAPKPVLANGNKVAAAALLAGGSVVQWSHHITDHNGGVDKINKAFESEMGNDFGVAAADYSDAKTAEDRADVDSDRAGDVSAAYTSRQAFYQKKYEGLLDDLDSDATSVSSTLKDGPTEEAIKKLLLAGALPSLALSLFPGLKLSKAEYQTLLANLRKYGELKQFLTPTCMSSEDLKRQLDAARAMGVHPTEYADLLQQYWLARACEKAGIDLCAWDPSLGADAMLPYLVASYRYYGQLYLDNPDFQWAGMAGMIGPTFAGGMFDLQMLRQLADLASAPLDAVPGWAKGPLLGVLPPPLRDLVALGEMGESEFRYFENSLLSMQKQIFTDQMPMHEAYLAMGMDGIEEMRDAGLIDQYMLDAWEDIDSGDPDRVASGNADLLYREQHDIIGDDYDNMRDHDGPVGEAMTYVMGAIGAPGIPGAQALGEYDPLTFGVDVDPWGPGPHGSVEVETPLPAGNISNFDTRWDLIEHDTLPAFRELIANDPEQVREILSGDVEGRIDDARLANNIDEILGRLSDWDVRVDGGLW